MNEKQQTAAERKEKERKRERCEDLVDRVTQPLELIDTITSLFVRIIASTNSTHTCDTKRKRQDKRQQ
jgi:hypothetical protein